MTVNATDSFVYREGNGVTTTFPFSFRADSEETVLVELIFADGSTRPLLTSEYTVALADIGGSVTTQLPGPVEVGQRLYIWRDTTIEQEVSVSRQTGYNPAVVENVWDRLTMSLQELAGKLKLTMSLPPGSDATTAIAQVLEARAEAEAAALVADNAAIAAAQSADAAAAAENSLLEWKGAWVTSTVYEPSDIVREAGSSYVCVIAHTSGVFATDLSAGRWQMFAQQGAAGPGSGDMLAANNLSDLEDAPTARSNLGLGTLATVSPTGTADATTRLAGDGTWKADGWRLVDTITPGAVSNIELDLTGLTEARIMIQNCSPTAAAAFRLELRGAVSGWSATSNLNVSVNAVQVSVGTISLHPAFVSAHHIVIASMVTGNVATPPQVYPLTLISPCFEWASDQVVDRARLSWSTGNFDAGRIQLWGR